MLCLTCHQPCRENLPPPPIAHRNALRNTHTHTQHVPSPQSAGAEVTRQVAANKALRGQLQEKEDKLRQLQDRLVSHLFLPWYYWVFLLVSFLTAATFHFFSFCMLASVFVSPSPCFSSVGMFARSPQLPSVVFDSTMWQHAVCSTPPRHASPLAWIICDIMRVLVSKWIEITEGIGAYAHASTWVSCVSCSAMLLMWVAGTECWSKQRIDRLCAARRDHFGPWH